MRRLTSLSASRLAAPVALRRLAFASVAANVGIVVTGGAVRLTGSGLGCPTWPRCTDSSYVATDAMGAHGVIEFGNRTLSFALGLIAVAGLVVALAQRPRRRAVVWPAALVLLGIPAQAVIGGITVLTDLNPWVVGGHFLVSIAVIAAAYAFWRATVVDAPPVAAVNPALRGLVWVTVAVCGAVLVAGTVVTGSGPHSGDANARRTGLDPAVVAQVHADLVFLLLGLSVAMWFALRSAAPQAARAAAVLVAVEVAQGLVGIVQYVMHLPPLAVGLHLLGACLVWLATLSVLWAVGARRPTAAVRPEPALASVSQ